MPAPGCGGCSIAQRGLAAIRESTDFFRWVARGARAGDGKHLLHMAFSLNGVSARENDDTDFLSRDNWVIFVELARAPAR